MGTAHARTPPIRVAVAKSREKTTRRHVVHTRFRSLRLRAGGMAMDGLLYWLIVGLIAGWLAGVVMKGGGYGIAMDIVLGVLGAVVGGWIFSMLGLGSVGLIGGIIVAFVGAVALVAVTRVVK